jgi:hypothetical protein
MLSMQNKSIIIIIIVVFGLIKSYRHFQFYLNRDQLKLLILVNISKF